MADVDVNEVLQKVMEQNQLLAQQNIALNDRLSALETRVPSPEPEPLAPGRYLEYPKVLYRLGGKPGQVDHPDHEALTVASAADEALAVSEGWKAEMEPVPPPPVVTVAGKKK